MVIDIVLSPIELAQRGVPYSPIRPVPEVYTHVGSAKNFRKGRRLGVRMIIDHTTEAGTSVVGALRYDARRSDLVSCTAFAANDGLGYDVAEVDTAFTTGRWNDESLSCETVGKTAWSEDYWRAHYGATIANKIDLFEYWCRTYSIPPVWLSAEKIAQGATRQGVTPWVAGVNRGICDHREANLAAIMLGGDPVKYSHTDVGAGMRSVLIHTILPTVAARLNQQEETDVLTKILKPTGDWANNNMPHLGCFDSGVVRPMVSNDIANPTQGTASVADEGQYRRLCDWANVPVPED